MLNYGPDATTGNLMEIDDLRIDSADEEAYTSPPPNGTFGTLSKQVFYPYPAAPETKTSAVSLWWDYTHGLVKAQQFAITISDGVAVWVERVRARSGTGALRHQVDVFRLMYNRPVTITLPPKSIRPGGQVPQAPAASWGTFTPRCQFWLRSRRIIAIVGMSTGRAVNIWFDSYQYRNNIAPSNGTGSITIQFIHAGSGAAHIVLTGMNTYTQGTYIATHLSVIVKTASGTIDLNRDMRCSADLDGFDTLVVPGSDGLCR